MLNPETTHEEIQQQVDQNREAGGDIDYRTMRRLMRGSHRLPKASRKKYYVALEVKNPDGTTSEKLLSRVFWSRFQGKKAVKRCQKHYPEAFGVVARSFV